ncbi:MAG: dienelactone hydrolase family protein [Myxococcota bacterium]|jgi:dienelactone hydrolase|nr:dienelactone hydrolase family protein [Myxococcota bacterium]
MSAEASLEGFDDFEFAHDGVARPVYRRGSGPGVVVMHEIPGITPEVAGFARRVAEEGFTVYMPHMFGKPNKPLSMPYVLGQMGRACISREFSVLARNESSPITDWLRALCRHAHAECGGSGVGAIGMCLTGNFALSLMVDESVMAPVLSQPSLPFGVSASHREALHLSDEDLQIVKRRANEGAGVLAMRFTGDPMCPGERFRRLEAELGDGFEAIEIDSGPGNPHGLTRAAHSVVTTELVDEDGHPTQAALYRIIEVFRERLIPSATA